MTTFLAPPFKWAEACNESRTCQADMQPMFCYEAKQGAACHVAEQVLTLSMVV